MPNDVDNEEKVTLETIWLTIQKKRNLLIGIGVFAALIILAISITLAVVLSKAEDLTNDKLLVIAGYQQISSNPLAFDYNLTSKTGNTF